MLKNLSRLEFTVNSKVYHILCDMDSPIADLKEVLFQAQKYVGQIEDAVKVQLEQKAKEDAAKEEADKEPPKEEVKPEGS